MYIFRPDDPPNIMFLGAHLLYARHPFMYKKNKMNTIFVLIKLFF